MWRFGSGSVPEPGLVHHSVGQLQAKANQSGTNANDPVKVGHGKKHGKKCKAKKCRGKKSHGKKAHR